MRKDEALSVGGGVRRRVGVEGEVRVCRIVRLLLRRRQQRRRRTSRWIETKLRSLLLLQLLQLLLLLSLVVGFVLRLADAVEFRNWDLVLKDSRVLLLLRLLAVGRTAHQDLLDSAVKIEHVGVRRRRRRQPVDVGERQRRQRPLGWRLRRRQRTQWRRRTHWQSWGRPIRMRGNRNKSCTTVYVLPTYSYHLAVDTKMQIH